jgi:hypothetical protein
MFMQHNDAFGAPSTNGGLKPLSFDRHLVTNLLASVYSGALKEPLPDRLERLVRELELREATVRDR